MCIFFVRRFFVRCGVLGSSSNLFIKLCWRLELGKPHGRQSAFRAWGKFTAGLVEAWKRAAIGWQPGAVQGRLCVDLYIVLFVRCGVLGFSSKTFN